MSDNQELVTQFTSLGLSNQKAQETVKNANLCKRLKSIAHFAVKAGYSLPENGKLFYHLASRLKTQHENSLELLIQLIGTKKLNTTLRVDAALEFILSNPSRVVLPALEAYCGVGVHYTEEDIKTEVANTIRSCKSDLLEGVRAKAFVMVKAREKLKWADGKAIVHEVNKQLEALGHQGVEKTKKEIEAPKSVKPVAGDDGAELTIIDVMKRLNFHKPGENYKTDGYITTDKTSDLLKEHLRVTGGKVRTRFPPEPNGILHIGHAKAININFGYAAAHDGICFLRYDDTNPEKEEQKFFDSIQEMVEWLGYKPYKITHSSDYFDQLHQLAVKLIKRGLAYVCHQKQVDIKGFNPPPSPWRERPIAENLMIFDHMRRGLYAEGEAILRMKVALEEGKQDPVAYRIKFLPHPRTGNKWCIYPTYDYTHCLCDSLEHITHSLCTKEFQSRRSSYYWLCNVLDLYCPVQWEYGRLNVNYTVVSKRKIAKLIEMGIVRSWDDPRLYTLTALKRRGFPPEAINKFCAKMGVTGAQTVVDPQMIEAEVRTVLNDTAPRTMVVTEPLRVVIKNFATLQVSPTVDVPDFPSAPEKGAHKIYLRDVIYIEQSDFKLTADKSFHRFATDQPVGLKYAGLVLSIDGIRIGNDSSVKELLVTAVKADSTSKPKAFIHWVANPIVVELRMYDKLFIHKNPEDDSEVPGGYLSDVNQNSLKFCCGLADRSICLYVKKNRVFQFERIGFFCVDPDSNKTLVFNRTVTLKEDSAK